MIKVSVIVPVYNVEKYINRCIDSILNQTFKDFELILINDGSTDKSLEIINSYKKDKRVKIFTQKNQGAAVARNIGLENALGKYVTFIDSDDYIDNNFLEKYVSSFEKNTDIVLGGYNHILPDKKKVVKPKLCTWDAYRFSATCGKMYLRSFLVKNKVRYGNTEFLEDVTFNLNCLFLNANYKFIKVSLYNYVYNPKSISNSYGRKKEQIINVLDTLKYIDSLANKCSYYNDRYLINYYMNTYLFMIFMNCRKCDYSFMKENVNNFMDWLNKKYPHWKKEINKIKEVDTLNKIVISFWKGVYNIKLHNLVLFIYSKI